MTIPSEPTSQVGYFRTWSRFDKERILAFGIRVLESYGNRSDRSLLRQYAATQEFGEQAIAALRAIEERLSTLSSRRSTPPRRARSMPAA